MRYWWWPWRLGLTVMLGLVVAGLILAACAAGPSSQPVFPDTARVQGPGDHFWLNLGDGTKVECWYIGTGYGATCDWVGYHERLHSGTGGGGK
jgi:hypothetical protein